MTRYDRLMRVRNALVHRSFERELTPSQCRTLERVRDEIDALEMGMLGVSQFERFVERVEQLAGRVQAAVRAAEVQ